MLSSSLHYSCKVHNRISFKHVYCVCLEMINDKVHNTDSNIKFNTKLKITMSQRMKVDIIRNKTSAKANKSCKVLEH